MTFVSHAQNLEDVILWRALRDVENGFYIDIGAWDPRVDSVTLAFYERGWRGINVEPDPTFHAALLEARPIDTNLQIAIADRSGTQPFFLFPSTGWSTLDPAIASMHQRAGHAVERRSVRVETLKQVCDRHAPQAIHFLKIDAEGAEAAILAGADLARHRPWIVLIEATEPNSPSPNHQAWEGKLLEADYRYVYFDGLNRYYVAAEHAERLGPCFLSPPNVFDDYISLASLRRTLHFQKTEGGVHELDLDAAGREAQFALQRQDDAERHARAIEDAEARLKEAELKALDAEIRSRFVEADRAAGLPAPAVEPVPAEAAATGVAVRDVYYDAGLILHFGLKPPVGIVRVEQYVAELLALDPAIRLRFVVFDGQARAYRDTSTVENGLLQTILFGRYGGSQKPELSFDYDSEPTVAEGDDLSDADLADDGPASEVTTTEEAAAEILPATPDPAALPLSAVRPPLVKRISNVLRMLPEQFEPFLSEQLRRRLPIHPQQPRWQRLGMRVVRRSTASGLRLSHTVVRGALTPVQAGRNAVRHIARPDVVEVPPVVTPLEPPPPPLQAPPPLTVEPPVPDNTSPPGAHVFHEGDVLISIANTWDYMDYGYLTGLVRKDKVKFVSVIYDVIAMEMPFTTPAPIHSYHRHWVELGHVAAHLVAISQHSLDTYRRFIAEPNDIDPPMSVAYLPNFLHERRQEIGETAVSELVGRRFVVFCSTIETRKNHQTLLHAWERLRQTVALEELPILVFVGGWGWGTETVRLLSERNWRLRDHLRILNNISDAELIWLYRNSLFTAFPALSEGFGLAAAESLSFGTPVVVSNCPALIEASEGLMPSLDPLDVPAWVEELRRLITDETYLDELRQRAARYKGVAYHDFGYALRDALLATDDDDAGE